MLPSGSETVRGAGIIPAPRALLRCVRRGVRRDAVPGAAPGRQRSVAFGACCATIRSHSGWRRM